MSRRYFGLFLSCLVVLGGFSGEATAGDRPPVRSSYVTVASRWVHPDLKVTFMRTSQGDPDHTVLPLQAANAARWAKSMAANGEPPPQPPQRIAGICPDPRTCEDFTLLGGSWPTNATGDFNVPYWVNLTTPRPVSDQTDGQILEAIDRGAKVWTSVNSHVRATYQGLTAALPGQCGNVVSFAADILVAGYANLCVDIDTGQYVAFDMVLPVKFTWRPCDPAKNQPCTPYDGADYTTDLQQVATHEWFHVFGADHPSGGADRDDQLSGWSSVSSRECSSRCRFKVTPGRGDEDALDTLYPDSHKSPVYLP